MSQPTVTERLKKLKDDIVIAFEGFTNPAAPAPAAPAAPVAYEGALITGEIVRATPSLAEGSVLSIVSESGDLPAPDGTHQLADGSTVEVANGAGQITSVTLPAPAAQPPAQSAMGMSAEEKTEFEALKLSNTELKTELEKTKTEHAAKLTEIEAKFSKMEEVVKLSVEGFIALAEVPVGEPTTKPKTEKVELSGEERAEDYLDRIKKMAKDKTFTIKK